jgi:aromatic ring-cleaving dioxygenase
MRESVCTLVEAADDKQPAQFGAFVSWLVIARGPLSVLIHPNTVDGDDFRNHSQRATWLGTPYPLNLGILSSSKEKEEG